MSIPEALLNYLREHSERVLARDELASAVWKLRIDSRSRVIDQTISQVRKRLEPDERILATHGVGYQYQRVLTNQEHANSAPGQRDSLVYH